MKHFRFMAMLFAAAALTFTACGGGGDDSGGGGEVTFNMVPVNNKTFPIGTDDPGSDTVTYNYYIAETEVTYELWHEVYTWATDAARGAYQYSFANPGMQGDNDDRGIQHPVTYVNWRDCVVWCNALTEWYNAREGTGYICVYTYSTQIIRDSRDDNYTACDSAVASSTAKGFRLPTSNEWELAARWRSDTTNTVIEYTDPYFTKGNSASGATADYNDAAATQAVAWYSANSSTTHAVKGKPANSLGLYDMSGNVWEWNTVYSWYSRHTFCLNHEALEEIYYFFL